MATKKTTKKGVKTAKNKIEKWDLIRVSSGTYPSVGTQGMVTQVQANRVYIEATNGSSYWVATSVVEKITTEKSKFILQYMMESDPFEIYETLEAVKERINHLMNEEDGVKAESFIIYEVSKATRLKVKKTVEITGL